MRPGNDWPGILGTLVANPTPSAIYYFDKKYGKGNGFSAKDVLDALGVEGSPVIAPAASAAAAAAPARDVNDPNDPQNFLALPGAP